MSDIKIKNQFLENHLEHFVVGAVSSGLFYSIGMVDSSQLLPAFAVFTSVDYVKKHWRESVPMIAPNLIQ